MLRKGIINFIIKQGDTDKAFENEALAVFIEGQVTNRLLNFLSEQDIVSLENLKDDEIVTRLTSKVPNLNEIIKEEVEKVKEKFQIKMQPAA